MRTKFSLAAIFALSMRTDPAPAYTFFQGAWPCSSAPQRWAPPSSGIRYIHFSDQCLSGANYNSSVSPAGMQSAGAWGSWMWRREGVNKVEVVYDGTWCVGWWTPGDTSWFYSGSNNRYGLDNMSGSSYAQSPCNPSTGRLGCGVASSSCGFFGWDQTYDSGRVAIRTDYPWAGDLIDTVDRCTSPGYFAEHVWLHEWGHLYGLNHFDGWMTLMNSASRGDHHCNVGSGYHSQPYSDETSGLNTLYVQPNIYTVRNVSATPTYIDSSGVAAVDGSTQTRCASQMFDVMSNIMYMVHHAAIPGGLSLRLAVLAPGYSPAPENTLWLGPTITIPSNWTFAGATYQYPISASNIPGSVGGTDAIGLHRVWIQLDPNNAIAETDEGDNWIPTRWMLRRVDGC